MRTDYIIRVLYDLTQILATSLIGKVKQQHRRITKWSWGDNKYRQVIITLVVQKYNIILMCVVEYGK